jgi:hypothetical protein
MKANAEAFDLHNKTNSLVRSTNAFSFMRVVNGPISKGLEMKHVAEDIAEFELPSGAAIIISPMRVEKLKAQGYTKMDNLSHATLGKS